MLELPRRYWAATQGRLACQGLPNELSPPRAACIPFFFSPPFPICSGHADVLWAICTAFEDWCTSEGLKLSGNRIKATPTALTSTGDPLSIFEAETPGGPLPLIPTTFVASQPTTAASQQTTTAAPQPQPNKQGVGSGAVGLNAFWAFATSAAIATTVASAILGASFL